MKTKKKQKNYAFIDSQNLNLAIRGQGWILDFKRFLQYLKDKYKTSKVFLFIGYIKKNQPLYDFLTRCGYKLIFKPTVIHYDGEIKGNVDAELVLHAMIEFNNYDKAIIISGDGDFYCLIDYWKKKNKLCRLLVPNFFKYSALLRKFTKETDYMNKLRAKLEYKQEVKKARGINLRTKP